MASSNSYLQIETLNSGLYGSFRAIPNEKGRLKRSLFFSEPYSGTSNVEKAFYWNGEGVSGQAAETLDRLIQGMAANEQTLFQPLLEFIRAASTEIDSEGNARRWPVGVVFVKPKNQPAQAYFMQPDPAHLTHGDAVWPIERAPTDCPQLERVPALIETTGEVVNKNFDAYPKAIQAYVNGSHSTGIDAVWQFLNRTLSALQGNQATPSKLNPTVSWGRMLETQAFSDWTMKHRKEVIRHVHWSPEEFEQSYASTTSPGSVFLGLSQLAQIFKVADKTLIFDFEIMKKEPVSNWSHSEVHRLTPEVASKKKTGNGHYQTFTVADAFIGSMEKWTEETKRIQTAEAEVQKNAIKEAAARTASASRKPKKSTP